jgi:signal transduction histidine kinase
MGTHGATGTRARVLPRGRNADASIGINPARRRLLNLSDWPVARRLFAVIVAALLMGLVFGGLRVYDSEGSATQFSRVSQLANLSEQLTVLVNDLQNERDETLLNLTTDTQGPLRPLWAQTHTAIAAVQRAASGISGLPSNIQADLTTVLADISPNRISPNRAGALESALDPNLPPQDEGAVMGNYDADISDMIVLADQVSQGVSEAALTSDVQALNALALAKEQASEERGLINYAIKNPGTLTSYFNPNILPAGAMEQDYFIDPTTVQTFSTVYDQEFVDEASFQASATPAESAFLSAAWGAGGTSVGVSLAENVSQNIMANDNGLTTSSAASASTLAGSPLLFDAQGLGDPVHVRGGTVQTQAQVLPAWDAGQAAKLSGMQATELFIAGNIVNTAGQLEQSARQAALTSGIITVAVLLVVLLAALVVARSLVLPLRRLRAGALNIASVQLPERVRLLTESPDAATSMEVAPINVPYKDEIGEVARAFDQVHSEAVRLAGEQALLRSTFNAMFVNLSRRSQSLIERLARMIDNLEQNEADPDRLGSLFSMDHLVTRMRRNSENLLLLAGHENPRKRSESVPLADVARAAISEIEQYNRIALNIAPAIAVIGVAVSDVAHLLAELIENATIFSPKDTQVQVVMQEVSSGGVLIEIRDKGIGVSDARLADMNWRLDNPPTIDVSVSRHMGLFAVARLAERHQVRVRLRPATPQGLSALVWLPESVVERTGIYGIVSGWQSQVAGTRTGAQPAGGRPLGEMPDAVVAPAPNMSAIEHGSYVEGPRIAKGWFRGRGNGTEGLGGGQNGSAPPSRSFDDRASAGLPARSGPGTDLTSAGLPTRAPRTNLNSDSGPDPQRGLPDWADSARGGPVPSIGSSPGEGSGVPGRSFDYTSTGLPVRTPRTNLNSDAGSDSKAGLPQRADSARGGPTPGSGTLTGSQPLPQRSAEQVRNRLAGFQRGTRRAESEQGQSPRAGEGSER